MLMSMHGFQIFLYPKSIDMRAGYDKLAQIVKDEIGLNPYSGAVFLFFNRDRTRARIYFYDGSGSCLYSKRLEKGRFKIPVVDPKANHAVIESSELCLLLEGADVTKVIRPKRWTAKFTENESECALQF
jgi:transposase